MVRGGKGGHVVSSLHGVGMDKNNASRHYMSKVILLHFQARTRSGCLFYLFIIYIFVLKKVSKFVNNLRFLSTNYPVRWRSFHWLSFFSVRCTDKNVSCILSANNYNLISHNVRVWFMISWIEVGYFY